jgi:hypothetical protein
MMLVATRKKRKEKGEEYTQAQKTILTNKKRFRILFRV